MSDLAEWLSAQLDADEAVARKATAGPWFREYGDVVTTGDDPRDVAEGYDEPRAERISRRAPHRGLRDAQAISDAAHIALHDPAFVLADIAALRAVIEEHQPKEPEPIICPTCCHPYDEEYFGRGEVAHPCPTLLALAQPYRDRPGWRDEWTAE